MKKSKRDKQLTEKEAAKLPWPLDTNIEGPDDSKGGPIEPASFISRLEVATIKYELAIKQTIEALKGRQ